MTEQAELALHLEEALTGEGWFTKKLFSYADLWIEYARGADSGPVLSGTIEPGAMCGSARFFYTYPTGSTACEKA